MARALAPTSDLAEPLGGKKRRYSAVYSQFFPDHYRRTSHWSSMPDCLVPPTALEIDVGGDSLWINRCADIDLAAPDVWDEARWADLTNRAGKDFYIYACAGKPSLILSNNATTPSGNQFTPENTRKIGGFHCLCRDVGNIGNHPLSGLAAGQILPASVWDLRHRPRANPEGMAYSEETGKWYQIYLTGSDGTSRYGAAPASSKSTTEIEGYPPGSLLWFIELLAREKMTLLSSYEFQLAARHSNEKTQTHSSGLVNPIYCGGHIDTTGRRMISGIGLEDCCGHIWQWLCDDASYPKGDWFIFSSKGNVVAHPYRTFAGGSYGWADNCGSLCRWTGYHPNENAPNLGARGVSEPLVSF